MDGHRPARFASALPLRIALSIAAVFAFWALLSLGATACDRGSSSPPNPQAAAPSAPAESAPAPASPPSAAAAAPADLELDVVFSSEKKDWAGEAIAQFNGYSNSGLIAVLAEAYAGAGKTRDLTLSDVDAPATRQFLREAESSVVHSGRSTGFFQSRAPATRAASTGSCSRASPTSPT